jgi:exopolysaccharide biosynthesis protein
MPDGGIVLTVVDGVEVLGQGLDLFEFAEILITAVGVKHAINIDGGGSSDAVLNGKVWSRPTCDDTYLPVCERPVTSITCIRPTPREM